MHLLWIYYLTGIAIWIAGTLISSGDFYSWRTLGPSLFVIGVLGFNFFVTLKKYEPKEYKIEERLYEYVERNAYYLIVAITIFLLVSTNESLTTVLKSENANIIIGSQVVAVVLCILVLSLVWMSTQEPPKGLVHLRHIKTVIYTFAMGIFLIGPATILVDTLDHSEPIYAVMEQGVRVN